MKNRILFTVMTLLCMMMSSNLWAQTPYAVYCEGDQSFHFLSTEETLSVGGTLASNGQTITLLWKGDDVTKNCEWKYDWDSETNTVPDNTTKIVFEESFKDVRPESCYRWFHYFTKLTEIENIENLNTSAVTDMGLMFSNCSSLTSLDMSKFNTDNVTNMSNMFNACSSLTTLDLSSFNTSKVTDMSNMFGSIFGSCSGLTSLDLSNFNTGNVTNMSGMFYGCSGLISLDLSNFNTGNVTNMSHMFDVCRGITSLNVSNFNTGNVTNMSNMFCGCSSLISLDLSNFNTGNVTDMSVMFWDCHKLVFLDVSNFNTSNVTNMYRMFCGCSGLTSLDVSHFNTDNVTNMNDMFFYCSGLTSLDVSDFNTENVLYMSGMFRGCSGLTSINLKNFYTSETTVMSNMCSQCSSLKYITIGEKIKQMPTFYDSYNIKKVISYIKEPYAIDFFAYDVNANAKLYVPAGTKHLYAETEGWKEFVNIVANDLVAEDGENPEISIDGIDENTDLDGNLVGNIFFNIPENGGEYDAAEDCITLKAAMTDEDMENVIGLDMFDESVLNNFTGMIFLLDAGSGTLEIEAATTGGMLLNVKVGDAEPVVNTSGVKTKLSVPYSVTEPTYVYIYGSLPAASEAKGIRKAEATDAAVKIYSIKWAETVGVDSIMQETENNSAVIYNLKGQRVNSSYKGVVIINGKKVIMK